MQREIILDTETTGLDPVSGHRIVEIGCVELLGKVKSGKFFHTYLNPERDMPEEAFRVHGLSVDFLKKKPLFSEMVDEFIQFIGDSPLVIHNAGFDMRFINAELERIGFAGLPRERAIDTDAMARKKFPGAPVNLNALCKRFDIDISARTKHGALLDAELLAEVYIELQGGRQVSLLLEEEIVVSSMDFTPGGVERPVLEAREFPVPPEELEAHAHMLARLKKPLWAA